MLTRLKQTRDSLRLDNQRLRQRGGLVCHTQLLRDFEDRQDQVLIPSPFVFTSVYSQLEIFVKIFLNGDKIFWL